MRFLKPKSFLTTVGLVLTISGLMCMGSEKTEASNSFEPTQAVELMTPAVIAHFHLSGMLSESPVVDPFNLAAGQVMSLKTLVSNLRAVQTSAWCIWAYNAYLSANVV